MTTMSEATKLRATLAFARKFVEEGASRAKLVAYFDANDVPACSDKPLVLAAIDGVEITSNVTGEWVTVRCKGEEAHIAYGTFIGLMISICEIYSQGTCDHLLDPIDTQE